mmetsp:Transcript_16581/g.28226  ORF Transcript_16581/g.28226 Transcript_16581/m.28226 type:complete len:109 (-) Transcript_16581:619-945(-)
MEQKKEGFESNAQLAAIVADVPPPNPELLEKARVLLIRHAATQFNIELQPIINKFGTESQEFREFRVRRDLIDPPLDDIGLAQCASGREHVNKIDFKVVFVSPMYRTC